MLNKLFSRGGASSKPASAQSIEAFPQAGNIYAFATSPVSEFSSTRTGRYAAIKILAADPTKLFVVAVLDGIWHEAPSLKDAQRAAILDEHRFPDAPENRFRRGSRAAVFGAHAEWWLPAELSQLALLGCDRISAEEAAHVAKIIGHAVGTRNAALVIANQAAEGEWRWANDREAFMSEIELRDAKHAALRAAKEERYRTRLSKLTWDDLLAETPFERWAASPPYPSPEFTADARVVVHQACRDLSALGSKPRKADVRAVLKRCVQWFNEADGRAGGVIETDEREDICAVLEEMAHVARQKSLVEEIDEWREW